MSYKQSEGKRVGVPPDETVVHGITVNCSLTTFLGVSFETNNYTAGVIYVGAKKRLDLI